MRRAAASFASLVLIASTLPVAPAWSETPEDAGCQWAEQQPEDVDFDNPEQQLEKVPVLLIPDGASIANVRITSQPIFDTDDPDQDGWFQRAVNVANVPTREGAIASQLVFSEGDRYEPSRLQESERVLRDKDYLVDAWVRPYRVCGDQVDVAVVTRDTWTLLPTVGFSRSGGENTTHLGLSDDNFLGTGKALSLSRSSDEARTEYGLEYFDPNILGSRWQTRLNYVDSSDGLERGFELERPFYRRAAPWSAGIRLRDGRREEDRYFGGDAVSTFGRELEEASLHTGVTLSSTSASDRRLLAGYRYRQDRFRELDGETAPVPFPQDRTLSYPWLGFSYEQNYFHETINLTNIQRVEDVRDGILFRTEVGYSRRDLGATSDQLVLDTVFSNSLVATDTQFAEFEVHQEGRYDLDNNRFESLRVHLDTEYFYGGGHQATGWYTRAWLSSAKNLTADEQLTLGGDNGLRGYPLRYQQGNQRGLFTLEKRYFSDLHPFHLFRLGGVAFFDAGRAWFRDGRENGPDTGVLRNLGVGLRASSSRFEVSRMLHLDLAFPLDGDDDVAEVQMLIRGKSHF